ncbi:MAG: hypothetical protein KGL35_19325 [Bradyrhizobium sp.]|nr:hypothetical protein [Bradyrhizobium sp.]
MAFYEISMKDGSTVHMHCLHDDHSVADEVRKWAPERAAQVAGWTELSEAPFFAQPDAMINLQSSPQDATQIQPPQSDDRVVRLALIIQAQQKQIDALQEEAAQTRAMREALGAKAQQIKQDMPHA